MKYSVVFTLLIALFLLILPLAALPKDSKEPPKQSESETASDTTSTIPSVEDRFVIWDEKNKETVTMDAREFIFYTVAAEMPVDYGIEALKAQTVASYTYFCYQRAGQQNAPSESLRGADFSDVPSCFPEGYTDEALREKWGSRYEECHQTLTKAVNAVFGHLMTYDGEPILAAYHAISCGTTEKASVVWNTDHTYLQSVPSPGDTLADEFETTTHFTAAEFAAALADVNGVSLSGTADQWLGKTVLSEAGTVATQTIGGLALTGRQVRKLFSLRSAAFTVDYEDGGFTFTVHGYGHGVGMSQYGAGYLARQGMTWEEILRYYYTGVTITDTRD